MASGPSSDPMDDLVKQVDQWRIEPRGIHNSLLQSLEMKLCWLKEGLLTRRNFQGNQTLTVQVKIDFSTCYFNKILRRKETKEVCIRSITNTLPRALNLHKQYLGNRPNNVDILFVGMNPAPQSPTGIPFYEREPITKVIGNSKFQIVTSSLSVIGVDVTLTSASGRRFWKLMRKEFGGDGQRFFDRCFVINYCPLIFTDQDGVNIGLDGFEKSGSAFLKELLTHCDESLRSVIQRINPKLVVTFGKFVEKRVKKKLSVTRLNIRHPSPKADEEYDKGKPRDERDKIWVEYAGTKLNEKDVWTSVKAAT